jgi:hypothetical protein
MELPILQTHKGDNWFNNYYEGPKAHLIFEKQQGSKACHTENLNLFRVMYLTRRTASAPKFFHVLLCIMSQTRNVE